MPVVYDGRYEIVISYNVLLSSLTLSHKHSFDVKVVGDPIAPGTPFNAIDVEERSGANNALDAFIQDYLDVWTPLLGTATTLEEVILWRYDDEPALTKTYISSNDTVMTTSFSGTSQAAQGSIYTFRNIGGRAPMRMYVMEPNSTGETRQTGTAITGSALAYMDYVVSLASPIVGRNNNFAIAKIAHNRGQNEHLRDLRFRGGV